MYLAATIVSEGTAAAENTVGQLRFDPFAMLPFCGYDMASYIEHWLRLGAAASSDAGQLPRIFMVNWFRREAGGPYLWPGYGDNARVLAWIIERCTGTADAVDTPIGRVPAVGAIDLDGLELAPDVVTTLLGVDPIMWREEARANAAALAKLGKVPDPLMDEQRRLEERLAAATG